MIFFAFSFENPPQPPLLDLSGVDLGDLIGRIRHHVLTNRIRVRDILLTLYIAQSLEHLTSD